MGGAKKTKPLNPPDIKARLKRWVVATSFFPCKQIYIACYKIVIWWVARYLSKDPAVGAVYLRGGATRGEIKPGISDIDLMIILRDEVELPPYALWRIGVFMPFAQRYRALLPWLPILDKGVVVVPAALLAEQALTSLQRRYSFIEMKGNGRLLSGHDYIAARMPELPKPIAQDALLACLETRWHWFVGNFIHQPKTAPDELTRQSLCYRYICDALRLMADFQSGQLTFKRSGVLSRHLEHLSGEERNFAEELIRLEQRRFLSSSEGLVEGSQRFLLRQLDRFCGQLAEHEFARPLKQIEQQVDCQPSEGFAADANQNMVEQLLKHVAEQWQQQPLGAYLVQSVYFNVDEQQLLVQVDPAHLPTNAQLAALYRLYENLQKQVRSKVRLFLLLPNMACCLATKGLFMHNLHCILPQALSVDLFAQLQQPSSKLTPGSYPIRGASEFTAQAGWFFWSQRWRHRQLLELWAQDRPANWTMVQQWWKWLQLEVVHRGIERGAVCYPLTLAAIGRELSAVGLESPVCLEEMATAYQRGVSGEKIGELAASEPALAYVRQVDPQGHLFSGPPSWLQDVGYF